jgi:alpha-D-xyloside xylohydrolase
MWGNEMLIAPVCSQKDTVNRIWLPPGQKWYNLYSDKKLKGDEIIDYKTSINKIPIFIKEGSIIPKYKYAQSTFTLDPSELFIDIYTGKDADFDLYEDDGISEKFRTKNEFRITKIEYKEKHNKLTIYPAKGRYNGAVTGRSYKLYFHGLDKLIKLKLNDEKLKIYDSEDQLNKDGQGVYWDDNNKILVVVTKKFNVDEKIVIE